MAPSTNRGRGRSGQQPASITAMREDAATVAARAADDPEYAATITSRFDASALFPMNPDATDPAVVKFPDGSELTMWCKPMLVGDLRKLSRAQRSGDMDAVITTLKELITDWDAYENGVKLDVQDDAVWDGMDTSVLTLIASAVGKSA